MNGPRWRLPLSFTATEVRSDIYFNVPDSRVLLIPPPLAYLQDTRALSCTDSPTSSQTEDAVLSCQYATAETRTEFLRDLPVISIVALVHYDENNYRSTGIIAEYCARYRACSQHNAWLRFVTSGLKLLLGRMPLLTAEKVGLVHTLEPASGSSVNPC